METLTASTIEAIQYFIRTLPLAIGLPIVIHLLTISHTSQPTRPIEMTRAVNQRLGSQVMRMMIVFVIIVNLAIIAIINL